MFIIQYHMISLWLFCQVYVIHHACKLQDCVRSFSWVFSLSSCIPTIAWLKYWVIELPDILHLILPNFQVVGSLRTVRNISQLHERIMEDDDDDSEAEVWDQKGPQIFLNERHERVISCDWGFIIIDDAFQSQAFWGLESWQFRDMLEMSWPLSRSQKICPSFCLKVGSQQGVFFLSHRQ